jgi:hypothetical protein
MIECSQRQSFNVCKRLSVSGHIPSLLGTWELSTVFLGKSVSQQSQAKGRKFVWVEAAILDIQVFDHGKQVERKRREIGDGTSMEGEF